MMDALYANRSKLEAIFHFFDTDGNGMICSVNAITQHGAVEGLARVASIACACMCRDDFKRGVPIGMRDLEQDTSARPAA
jgi:hypothetical protein